MSRKLLGGTIMSFVIVALPVTLMAVFWFGGEGKTEAATTPPIVSTPLGRYKGVVSTYDGASYVSYKSIPFAKPPVGALRFMRPQPLDAVSGQQIVNSDSYKTSCWSATKSGTESNYGEDCLYLNVYVPGDGAAPAESLPVMVWIHGGGFVAGSAFPEPGKIVIRGNVIVVSINYRLGVFGFLTTEDDDLPSNNGLWDQHMALKWVKENIHYFKGNDSSITIFGESSGAVSSSILALSPVTHNLFHKAILQSGSATTLPSRDHKIRAQEFGDLVGCTYTNSSEFAQCLRNVSVPVILKHGKPSSLNITSGQAQIDFVWMPAVDGKFIPEEPLLLLQNITYLEQVGIFYKDFLIGVLNNEGALVPTNFLKRMALAQISDKTFFQELKDYLIYSRYGTRFNISSDLERAVYEFYTGSPQLFLPPRPRNVLDFASDVGFVVPAVEMAMTLSKCHNTMVPTCVNPSSSPTLPTCAKTDAKVYLYHFDYCPPTDPCQPSCMVHGQDVALELPRGPITDPLEKQLSDTFIDLLTTFAKTSDPGTAVTSGWPAYDNANQFYLRIGQFPSVRQYLYDQRVNFWLKTVPDFVKFSS